MILPQLGGDMVQAMPAVQKGPDSGPVAAPKLRIDARQALSLQDDGEARPLAHVARTKHGTRDLFLARIEGH
jgi:hypothetical protein